MNCRVIFHQGVLAMKQKCKLIITFIIISDFCCNSCYTCFQTSKCFKHDT